MSIVLGDRRFAEVMPRPEPYKVLTVPDDGNRYAWLVEDYKTGPEKWDGRPRSVYKNYDPANFSPLPATIPTQKLFYSLSEAWQITLKELMRLGCRGVLSDDELLAAWRKTTRDAAGQFDRHTWNNVKDPAKVYTDYVQRLNVPPSFTEGDMAQQDLLFSRNIIKVIGEDARYLYYETLDVSIQPPDPEEIFGKWWLVGWLTQSTTRPIGDREWAHTRWPYFQGYGCPYLVLGRAGINKVEKYWCRDIEPGAEYSPYSP